MGACVQEQNGKGWRQDKTLKSWVFRSEEFDFYP
jgi:hypothetical protein